MWRYRCRWYHNWHLECVRRDEIRGGIQFAGVPADPGVLQLGQNFQSADVFQLAGIPWDDCCLSWPVLGDLAPRVWSVESGAAERDP